VVVEFYAAGVEDGALPAFVGDVLPDQDDCIEHPDLWGVVRARVLSWKAEKGWAGPPVWRIYVG